MRKNVKQRKFNRRLKCCENYVAGSSLTLPLNPHGIQRLVFGNAESEQKPTLLLKSKINKRKCSKIAIKKI